MRRQQHSYSKIFSPASAQTQYFYLSVEVRGQIKDSPSQRRTVSTMIIQQFPRILCVVFVAFLLAESTYGSDRRTSRTNGLGRFFPSASPPSGGPAIGGTPPKIDTSRIRPNAKNTPYYPLDDSGSESGADEGPEVTRTISKRPPSPTEGDESRRPKKRWFLLAVLTMIGTPQTMANPSSIEGLVLAEVADDLSSQYSDINSSAGIGIVRDGTNPDGRVGHLRRRWTPPQQKSVTLESLVTGWRVSFSGCVSL